MKKGLLATSAVALALTMTSAKAAEWSMDVGGFYTVGIGIMGDGVYDDQSIALVNDGEIHFDPSISLDNGLRFGAHVEMEAQTGAIDESDAFVKGSFGEIRIGANDGAQGKYLSNVCPTYTCGDDGFLDRTGANSIDTNGGNSSDDIKISYFSPSFAGFGAAVSYVPTDGDAGSRISSDVDANSFEAGAGYSGDFGSVSFSAGVGYYHAGLAAEESNFGGTVSVGFSAITVGAQYQSDDGGDDTAFGLGATYDTGPWNFGVHYADGLDDAGVSSDAWNAGIGASYALAKGITAGATLEFGDDGSDDTFAGGAFLSMSF